MLPLSFRVNVSKTPPSHWLIDSRATEHMALPCKYFTYSPCPSNKKIATTDGTPVAST